MKMDYFEFVEQLKREIRKFTGLTEKEVYFKKDTDYPPTEGDRLCVAYHVWESNKEVFALYTESLYEAFCNGSSLEEVVREIEAQYKEIIGSGSAEIIEQMEEYQKICSYLFVRLLNVENHEKELQEAVYRQIEDIAITLYLDLGKVNEEKISMKIPKALLERWGIHEREVLDHALENTKNLMPPRLIDLSKLLLSAGGYNGEAFMDQETGFLFDEAWHGVCLTNISRVNGASAVFLPGVAERLAELIGSGFYVVFTSIHEAMIHDDRNITREALAPILSSTLQECVSEEDFLTRKIGHYHPETGEFSWE